MSTRGCFGVRVDGCDKLSYNHFDSYPSGLGQSIVDEIREFLRNGETLDYLKTLAQQLRLVENENSVPSDEDIARLEQYADTDVSTGEITEWYVLLRNLHGKLLETLNAGVMIDSRDFIDDSLFCEYAYIVNLDTQKLEVYRGFQKKYHTRGRYAARKKRGWKPEYEGENYYYPCALVVEFDLTNLPENLKVEVEKVFRKNYPEDYEDE